MFDEAMVKETILGAETLASKLLNEIEKDVNVQQRGGTFVALFTGMILFRGVALTVANRGNPHGSKEGEDFLRGAYAAALEEALEIWRSPKDAHKVKADRSTRARFLQKRKDPDSRLC